MTTPSSTTTTPASAAPDEPAATPADPSAGTAPAARTAARFLLLGDSHAGPIGRAAAAAGIECQGGPLGAGREFTAAFFQPRARDVVFDEPEAERLYRGFLAALGADGIGEVAIPVVATFGFSAHFYATADNWRIYRGPDGFLPGFVASRLFDDIIAAMARDAIAFYRHVRGLGARVLAVMPPQRVPGLSDPEIFMAAQETMRRALAALDIEIVDLRARVVDETGRQRPEFCEPNDPIHGNLAFGRLILADLLARGL